MIPVSEPAVGFAQSVELSIGVACSADQVEEFIDRKVTYVSLGDSLLSFHDKPIPFIRNCAEGFSQ
jgi:hypothetical protein